MKIRTFKTGATRDTSKGKAEYCKFYCPLVFKRFGEYMVKHQTQADGKMREGDNWQKGIPRDAYMESMMRHVHDLWMEHKGYESRDGAEEALCAIMFNAQGYLHETLKEKHG